MIQLNHQYSHTTEWQFETLKKLGTKLIDNKIMILAEPLGSGISYCTQIMPGVSLVLLDAVFTTEIMITRYKSDPDLYILQFDLSDELNEIIIENTDSAFPRITKSSFSFLNSQTPQYFKPIVGKRVFTLRLQIDKNLLIENINNNIQHDTIENIEKNISFHNYIDSNSRILIQSLKNKSIFNVSFDPYIKGIALKILANVIKNYATHNQIKLTKIETEGILKTKEYLLDNLQNQFPSVLFLSKIAGMSISKYKLLFKKLYCLSPNQFFIQEKLILANKLITSKTFSSLTEILHLLNYSKSSYFCEKYFNYFGKKPYDDFMKKEN
jgi:AraC-like DNA-binding protein